MTIRTRYISKTRFRKSTALLGGDDDENEDDDFLAELGCDDQTLRETLGEVKLSDEATFLATNANKLIDATKAQEAEYNRVTEWYKQEEEQIEHDRQERAAHYELLIQAVRDEETKVRAEMYAMEVEIDKLKISIKGLSIKLTEVAAKISVKTEELNKVNAEYNQWVKAKSIVVKKQQKLELIKKKVVQLNTANEYRKVQIEEIQKKITSIKDENLKRKTAITEEEKVAYEATLRLEESRLARVQDEMAQVKITLKSTQHEEKDLTDYLNKSENNLEDIEGKVKETGEKKTTLETQVKTECNVNAQEMKSFTETMKKMEDLEKKQMIRLKSLTTDRGKAEAELKATSAEYEMKKKQSKLALAKVVANKDCFCSEQTHYNTQKISNMVTQNGNFRTSFGFTHYELGYLYMTLLIEADLEARKAASGNNASVQYTKCSLVKGINITDPKLTAAEIKGHLAIFLGKMLDTADMNAYQTNAYGMLILYYAYVAYENGISFDYEKGLDHQRALLVYGVLDILSKKDDSDANHGKLSKALDWFNQKATFPHLHCDVKECTETAQTYVDVVAASNDILLGVHGNFKYFLSVSEGLCYAKHVQTLDMATFNEMQIEFQALANQMTKTFSVEILMILMVIYLSFVEGIKESDDKRKKEIRDEMYSYFIAISSKNGGKWSTMLSEAAQVKGKSHYTKLFTLRAIVALALKEFMNLPAAKAPAGRHKMHHALKTTKFASGAVTNTHEVKIKLGETPYLSISNHTVKVGGSDQVDHKALEMLAKPLVHCLENADLFTALEMSGVCDEAIVLVHSEYCLRMKADTEKGAGEISEMLKEALLRGAARLKSTLTDSAEVTLCIMMAAFAAMECRHPKFFLSDIMPLYKALISQQLNESSDKIKKMIDVFYHDTLLQRVNITAPDQSTREMAVSTGQMKIIYVFTMLEGKCTMVLKSEGGHRTELSPSALEDEIAVVALHMIRDMFKSIDVKDYLRQLYLLSTLILCLGKDSSKNWVKGFVAAFIEEFTSQTHYKDSQKLKDKVSLFRASLKVMAELKHVKKHHTTFDREEFAAFEAFMASTANWEAGLDKHLDDLNISKTTAALLVESATSKCHQLYCLKDANQIFKFKLGHSTGLINSERSYFYLMSRKLTGMLVYDHDQNDTEGMKTKDAKRYEDMTTALLDYYSTINFDSMYDYLRAAMGAFFVLRSHHTHASEHKDIADKIIAAFKRDIDVLGGIRGSGDKEVMKRCTLESASKLNALFNECSESFKSGQHLLFMQWARMLHQIIVSTDLAEAEYFFTTVTTKVTTKTVM